MRNGSGIPEITAALELAAKWHADQRRKGTDIPYISHLVGVAGIVWEYGGGTSEIVAALLHDAAEDQGGETALKAIEDRFGQDVASIVRACSDAIVLKGEKKPDWWSRKRAYIQGLASAPAPVRLVSMADKLHNARAILADLRREGASLWSRFSGGHEGTLWYYSVLVDAYRAAEGSPETGTGSPLLEELTATVREILIEDRRVTMDLRQDIQSESGQNAPSTGARRGNNVVEECYWCGKPVRLGNACVTVVRNIEQVDWSDDLETEEFQVIDSEGLLFLCASCGNRLETEPLIAYLAIPH